MKRGFDLFFSILGLCFLCPLFVVVALIIVISDPGPIFFRQMRVGLKGKPFRIWKFRTMKVNNAGLSITVAGDKRVTRLGRALRGYKIDELPQLINIVKGEMSFVGPRPEVEKYVNLYNEEQLEVLSYRPGITDPASLKYRNENDILSRQPKPEEFYVNEILPDKISINLSYARKSTLGSDFRLILMTIFPGFFGRKG